MIFHVYRSEPSPCFLIEQGASTPLPLIIGCCHSTLSFLWLRPSGLIASNQVRPLHLNTSRTRSYAPRDMSYLARFVHYPSLFVLPSTRSFRRLQDPFTSHFWFYTLHPYRIRGLRHPIPIIPLWRTLQKKSSAECSFSKAFRARGKRCRKKVQPNTHSATLFEPEENAGHHVVLYFIFGYLEGAFGRRGDLKSAWLP